MDSNRIGQFLGLIPKMTSATESSSASKGGFADLLFGVMNKRASTVTALLPGSRVSTVLPVNNPGPANAIAGDARPQPNERLTSSAQAARGAEAIVETRPGNHGKPATDKSQDQVEAAAPGSDVSLEGESADVPEGADNAGEDRGEVELEGEAEQSTAGADGGDSETPPEKQQGDAAVTVAAPAMPVPAEAGVVAVAMAPGGTDAAARANLPSDNAAVAPVSDVQTGQELPSQRPQFAVGQTDGSLHQTDLMGEAQAEQPALPVEGGRAIPVAAAPESDATAPVALAVEPLLEETTVQVGLASRPGERRGEDPAAMFRQAQQPAKQRPAATSAGTAGSGAAQTAAQPAANAAAATAASTTTISGGAGPTTVLPLAPLGFDSGLGSSAGLTGWQLNLAQGATRRLDLVANLRQHLQNLPVHEQVAIGIQRAARDSGGRISLQLSPSELGRIHVRLEIDQEKNVRASVSVERPATLDLLQRDTKALERALHDAGLKMDQNDLTFNLQGGDAQSFAEEFGGDGNGRLGRADTGEDGDEAVSDLLPVRPDILATGDGMVDVQI